MSEKIWIRCDLWSHHFHRFLMCFLGSQQSVTSAGDGLRYRKDQLWRQFPIMESNGLDVENEALLESVLCSEISLIILDSLELIIQVGCLGQCCGSEYTDFVLCFLLRWLLVMAFFKTNSVQPSKSYCMHWAVVRVFMSMRIYLLAKDLSSSNSRSWSSKPRPNIVLISVCVYWVIAVPVLPLSVHKLVRHFICWCVKILKLATVSHESRCKSQYLWVLLLGPSPIWTRIISGGRWKPFSLTLSRTRIWRVPRFQIRYVFGRNITFLFWLAPWNEKQTLSYRNFLFLAKLMEFYWRSGWSSFKFKLEVKLLKIFLVFWFVFFLLRFFGEWVTLLCELSFFIQALTLD